MTDDLRAGLSRLLDEHDERRRAAAAREKKTKDDEALFLARFAQLRRELVRPVFEATGALLAERGHAFCITEQEFAVDASGKVSEAGIALHIEPAGAGAAAHADPARTFSLATRHYNKTVWISAGRSPDPGGVAGAKGACALERIDRQLIEAEVLRFVGAVMGS